MRDLMQQQRDLTQMDDVQDDGGMSARIGRRVYYYVGAVYNGQPIVLGRYYSYDQADQMGRSKLGDTPYKIYPKTCDMRTATKEIKYDLLGPENIDVVLNRARHVIEPDDE